MRTLIAGGGTGGHLTPALAVAQALRSADPKGEVIVVGRRGGVAQELVAAAGFPLATIPISGLDLSSVRSAAEFSFRMPAAVAEALRLIRHHRPHVVVGSAGYVAAPVAAAARLARVPVVLLEQNAIPGRTTRLLARRAAAVAVSFEETVSRLPDRATVVVTGNPVRAEVLALPAPELTGDRCRSLLVMGGSQGARRLNRAVEEALPGLLADDPELVVTHQTGSLDAARHDALWRRLPRDLQQRYRVSAFFEAVGPEVAAADLVVMRAGGSSLAEVAVLGRPMVLVPYPHAGGHQRHNATPYADAGAASLVDDADLDGARLRREVDAMVSDPDAWRARAAASSRLGRPQAAAEVAELILGVGRRAAARRPRR